MRSGVYIIRNTVNNKVYVGSSKNLPRRKIYHFNHLRGNKSHCAHLQHAFNKYGEDAFTFTVLERCLESELASREQIYLDAYKAADPKYGYNCIVNVVRIVFSEEMRQKMSIARKGKPQSDSHKRNRGLSMSLALRGRRHTETLKEKIRKSCQGINRGASRASKGQPRKPPKPVYQLDVNGVEIAWWPNVRQAALNTSADSAGIFDCITGRRHTSGGFKWRAA